MGIIACRVHQLYGEQSSFSFYEDEVVVSITVDTQHRISLHTTTQRQGITRSRTFRYLFSGNYENSISFDEKAYRPIHVGMGKVPHQRFHMKDLGIHSRPRVMVKDQYGGGEYRVMPYNSGYEMFGPVEMIPTNDSSYYGGQASPAGEQFVHVFELCAYDAEFAERLDEII